MTNDKYVFEILRNEACRFIVRVNGYEVDIVADDDGLSAEIFLSENEEDGTSVLITGADTAWGEPHINA